MNDFKKRYRLAGGLKKDRPHGSLALQQIQRANRFTTEIERSTKGLRRAIDEADASYNAYHSLVEQALRADSVASATKDLAKKLSALHSTIEEAVKAASPAMHIAEEMRRQVDEMNRAVNAAMEHVGNPYDQLKASLDPWTNANPVLKASEEIRRQTDLIGQLAQEQARVKEVALVVRQAEGARRSAEALERARDRLLKPGVTLDIPPNVPRYHADPEVPGRLIRILNGKRESGYFENGRFTPAQ